MRDYHFRERVSFRFLELSESHSLDICNQIESSSCRKHPEKDCFGGVVPLTDKSISKIVSFFEEKKLDQNDCDIFISISTESDSEIWAAPKCVNELLKFIDCEITFSFTSG